MGLIKAAVGAIGGTLADQWKEYFYCDSMSSDILVAKGQKRTSSRSSNTKGEDNIITDKSVIAVNEGQCMMIVEDGKVAELCAEPGEFIYDSQASPSVFGGKFFEGLKKSVKDAWERFKFGGQPGSQQLAFYVNLKEIPNNRFGTQSEIYWDDAYLNAQAGAVTRGTYTLKIIDPILFIKNFVPLKYVQANAPVFDFADMNNDAAEQLFNEVVGSLSPAFSIYTNDPSKGNRITKIQADQLGFAKSLSQAVEDGYQWKSDRGLEIAKVAIAAIEYDEDSKALLSDVKKADALSGARGNSFMQQSVARGMEAAGQNGGAMAMGMMGMGLGAVGNGVAGLQQPVGGMAVGANAAPQQAAPQQAAPQQAAPAGGEDPVAKMKQMKDLLDAGVITQEEFDAAKAKYLGI